MKTYNSNIRFMGENEKIMFVIKDLGALSEDKAVTMKQIIERGIALNLTSDNQVDNWEGYREGDHPWWPAIAPMSGVGSASAVAEYEEPYLHRKKVSMKGKERKTNVMVYWIDKSHRHQVVRKSTGSSGEGHMSKTGQEQSVMETRKTFSPEEADAKVASNPEKYILIDGKVYLRSFVGNHPEKFGVIANTIG